jgi:hypothetical protein
MRYPALRMASGRRIVVLFAQTFTILVMGEFYSPFPFDDSAPKVLFPLPLERIFVVQALNV